MNKCKVVTENFKFSDVAFFRIRLEQIMLNRQLAGDVTMSIDPDGSGYGIIKYYKETKPTCPNCAQFLDECLCIDEQEAKSFDLAAKAVAGIEDSLEQEAKPEHKPCPMCKNKMSYYTVGGELNCLGAECPVGSKHCYNNEEEAWADWDRDFDKEG